MDGNTNAHAAVQMYIGKPILVDLTDGTSFRAFVHAFDIPSTMVCLELIPSAEVILISTTNVKSLVPLPNPQHTRVWPSTVSVDVARVRGEESRVLRERHEKYMQLGVGVTTAAQTIFDTLAKTLPCKWDRDTIVILDTVRLAPPYNVNSISGDGDVGVVSRVRMILDKESNVIKTAVDVNGVTP